MPIGATPKEGRPEAGLERRSFWLHQDVGGRIKPGHEELG
jgi:hypothetical protein